MTVFEEPPPRVDDAAAAARAVDMECAALRHLAEVDPGLPVPRLLAPTVSVRRPTGARTWCG